MSLALRPTFSESWYRVVSLRPRLRPTAQISRQYYRGERWYVVRDPAGNQFHRLSDPAYRFVGLLDGSRTIGEAWDLVGGQLADDAPTQPEVIQILSQLFSANLIETDVTPDSAVVLKRQKLHNQRKMQQRLMNILFPRIPIWDPDMFVKGWMPVIRLMLSWASAVIWVIVIATAVVNLAPMWKELGQSAKSAIDPGNWLLLWCVFVVTKFIHEMGHAFSCRRFGGEVHEVGIMLLVLVPTPYVDASSAWGFPNKYKRIFVGAGGMIFELFVAAIAAFIWKATYGAGAGSLVNQLAYNTMLIASVSTVLFNANPLLRYDGYYILSDFWEIPNLQRKASEYTLGLVKRHIFRVKLQQPLPTPYQRVQLFFYAIASSCYRVFVSLAIAWMLFFNLPQEVKVIGLIMGAAAITTFALFPLVKLVKYLATDPELHRKRAVAWGFTGTVAAIVLVVVGLIRFPVTVRAEGVLEAKARSTIRVKAPGFVDKVLVHDGELVDKDQVLVELRNPKIALALQQQKLAREQAQSKVRAAAATGGAEMRDAMDELALARKLEAEEQKRFDDLTIRSPIKGTVVAPQIRNIAGQYLQETADLATVTQADYLEAFVVIDQADRDRLSSIGDYTAELRIIGLVDKIIPVDDRSVRIGPAAKSDVRATAMTQAGGGTLAPDQRDPEGKTSTAQSYEARIVFANPDEAYFPGQRTYVRFKSARPEPLLVQWYRWFQQLTMQSTRT